MTHSSSQPTAAAGSPSRARQLIETLGLAPHPEGGWYREVFRSAAQVQPDAGRTARSALTSIYFLLEADQHSRWHRVASDEVWIHLEGAPLALWTCDADLRTAAVSRQLGPVDAQGMQQPQHTVPAGQWQAARPLPSAAAGDGFVLVACTVAPGFDFADFSFMAPDGDEAVWMRRNGPALADLI